MIEGMGRFLGIACVAAMILALSGCGPAPDSEEGLWKALARDPGDVAARLRLAEMLEGRDQYLEAAALLVEGNEAAPDDMVLLEALATTYMKWAADTDKEDRFARAAHYWERLVDLGNETPETLYLLGYAQSEGNMRDQAFATYRDGAEQYPESDVLRAGLGKALFMAGKFERAELALGRVFERRPEDRFIAYWLAYCQCSFGRYAQALETLGGNLPGTCVPWWEDQHAELVEFVRALASEEVCETSFKKHYGFASFLEKRGRYDRAAAECEKALELAPADLKVCSGWCHRDISMFDGMLGDVEDAKEHCLKATNLFKECEETEPEEATYALGFAYQSLGLCYSRLARLDESRKQEYLEKSLAACQLEEEYCEKSENEHLARHALADVAGVLEDLYGREDERVVARRRRMVELIPEKGPTYDCSYASIIGTEAEFCLEEGNAARAEELYAMVADYYENSLHPADGKCASSWRNTLAQAALKHGDYEACLRHAEVALAHLRALRSTLGTDKFRRKVGGDTWGYTFDLLMSSALGLDDKPRAFDYAEQYRAQSLLEMLASKEDAEQLEAKGILVAQTPAERKSMGPLQGLDPSRKNLLLRTLELEDINEERLPEDISNALQQIVSFEQAKALGLEGLQPLLDGVTYISYTIGWNCTTIMVLTRDDVHAVQLEGVDGDALRELVDGWRESLGLMAHIQRDLALDAGGGVAAPVSEDAADYGVKLYETLIAPIRDYLKTDTLCISPDGILNYVPFEALGTDGRYLVEDFAISYTPSGTVLKLCMDRARNQYESVLAVGNPNLRNRAFSLAHAENEVNALQGLFPKVDVLVGDAAVEAAVAEQAAAYDILHFACHGELDLDEPMLTSLRLTPDDAHDGYLHAGEVFDYDLNASLVVLSACNSALGELNTGNELMGLTRSFLYAGAPAIIASLWTVDDRSTSFLMQSFYRNLSFMSKAEALRQAKLDTMKEYPDPFHWAAFCLQGDYR